MAPRFLWSLLLLAAMACSDTSLHPDAGLKPPPQPAPTSLRYPRASLDLKAGRAMAPQTPTWVGGAVTFTVSPALPAGLELGAATGVLSGTPAAASPEPVSHTFRASNASGSAEAVVVIKVARDLAAPSNLSYGADTLSLVAGQAMTPVRPTVQGEADFWDVTPDLPEGLTLDPVDGTLRGTPLAAGAGTYTFTAGNEVGSTNATVAIAIEEDLLPPSDLAYALTEATLEEGEPFALEAPEVTGAVAGFEVEPEDLPPGLVLEPDGSITGIPLQAQEPTSYRIRARNAAGASAPFTLTLTVTEATAPPVIASFLADPESIAPGGTVTLRFQVTGATRLVLTADTDPAWSLDLDLGSGSVRLSPEATTTYTLTASNSQGSVASAPVTVTQD